MPLVGDGGGIRVALVNNMPDLVLKDTESQFSDLLNAASQEIPIVLKLFSLPNIHRGDKALQYLSENYSGLNDLWKNQFDAVIVTGTEPRQADLQKEPYWPALVDLLDWAAENTTSTVLSCLATHAGVFHADGIRRQPLHDKQLGVFDFQRADEHPLTHGVGNILSFPHSRWNEVRADALTACGYSVLTQSAEAGVDLFVKERKKSVFVHFQGHPEYGTQTLLKEYRRDAKRYLKRTRDTYPSTPQSYFDATATEVLSTFRDLASVERSEGLIAEFPMDSLAKTIRNTWKLPARQIYRNWLNYIVSRKGNSRSIGSFNV